MTDEEEAEALAEIQAQNECAAELCKAHALNVRTAIQLQILNPR